MKTGKELRILYRNIANDSLTNYYKIVKLYIINGNNEGKMTSESVITLSKSTLTPEEIKIVEGE